MEKSSQMGELQKMRESKVLTILKKIPVYPESMKIRQQDSDHFDSFAPLCEENGEVSYVSQEAKEEYLRTYPARIKGDSND